MNTQGMTLTARESAAQGPYTTIMSEWTPRTVAPALYEALREAIPPIDAAIDRLTTLDGIVRVEGDNDEIVSEIDEWMRNVRVNDLQGGLQQFYRLQSNEAYEQGFTVGEFVLSKNRDEVEQLRVADSKGVIFMRDKGGLLRTWYKPPYPRSGRGDGTDQVERILRNTYEHQNMLSMLNQYDYREIAPDNIVYFGLNCEADNPYGTSLMRSMPFVARVLLTIDNALLQTWERFGSPAFEVTYKTKNRRLDETDLEKRRKTLSANLANVLSIKRQGNAADFVNAIGADDDLAVKVIGHDNQVLEVEMPARHVLEQLVAKTGLPSWMLGFHWSTAERLAATQGAMVIQESKTRFEDRLPGLNRIIETVLRTRGRTWKRGDWFLTQELPNLQDLVAQAQAEFLAAQTEMMRGNAAAWGEPTEPTGGLRLARVNRAGKIILPTDDDEQHKRAHNHQHKEDWAETDPALPRLERDTERELLLAWRGLYVQVLNVLGIDSAKGAKGTPVFVFDPAISYQALMDLADEFVAAVGAEDAALARNMYEAWVRGVVNAGAEVDADAVVEAARAQMRAQMGAHGLDLATATTTRALREDIIAALADGIYDGQNPEDVARTLRQRFGAHDVDWERIARSEISAASGRGKLDQYAALGIEQYDWVTSASACPICVGLAAGGPYTVGAGPEIMTDSHPHCLCTVVARVE